MNRLANYGGKWIHHSGWYPDVKLRLFDRRKGEWTGLIVHEKIELYKNGKIEHLKGDILHYSYHSLKDHRKQSEKFTTLGAQADFKKGKKAPFYRIWGRCINLLRIIFLTSDFLMVKKVS